MANVFNFKGAQFASFTYTNKQGVVSNYQVVLGFSYRNGQLENIEKLENASFDDEALENSRIEMLTKAKDNLDPKTKSNQSKAQDETYQHLHKGVKVHIGKKSPALNGNVYIQAIVVKKTQTEEQIAQTEINKASGNFEEKKVVKNGEKVLNRKKVEKALELRNLSVATFKFAKGSLESARINGETLEM